MDSIKMLSAGIFRAGSQFHYAHITELSASAQMHTHDFYELFLIVRGEIRHLINGSRRDMQTGDLALIRPEDCHCYERYGGASCGFVNLAFTPAVAYDAFRLLDHGFQRSLLGLDEPPYVRAKEGTTERALAALRGVSALPGGEDAAREAMLKSLLFELLTGFVRVGTPVENVPEWLGRLLESMREAASFTAGMEAMRALSGRTPEHLARSFRKYLGTTPTQYIQALRLNYIRNMLVDTDLGVAEVSAMAGFESVSHMNHLFRAACGMTPSEYRRRNRRVVIP